MIDVGMYPAVTHKAKEVDWFVVGFGIFYEITYLTVDGEASFTIIKAVLFDL